MPTIQTAIQRLEALGLVEIRHGVGTFVRSPRHDRTLVSAAVRRASVAELVDLRAQLDIHAARRAAERVARRASPRSVGIINLLATERFGSRFGAAQTFVDNDVAFHAAVAGVARSELDLTIALQGWLARRLNRTMLLATEAMVTDVDLDEDHWGMVEALRERDRAGVERLAAVIAARERVLTLDALR